MFDLYICTASWHEIDETYGAGGRLDSMIEGSDLNMRIEASLSTFSSPHLVQIRRASQLRAGGLSSRDASVDRTYLISRACKIWLPG